VQFPVRETARLTEGSAEAMRVLFLLHLHSQEETKRIFGEAFLPFGLWLTGHSRRGFASLLSLVTIAELVISVPQPQPHCF
jgi:hypothetical protein